MRLLIVLNLECILNDYNKRMKITEEGIEFGKKKMDKEAIKKEIEFLKGPIYLDRDGMPNVALLLLILITGIIPGILMLIFYRIIKVKFLEKKVKK
jgi:hypothetical protein